MLETDVPTHDPAPNVIYEQAKPDRQAGITS